MGATRKTGAKKAASESTVASTTKLPPETPEWLQRVARKFEAGRALSGSKAKLKPALDAAAVAALEKALGARLPDDYCAFLRHFASGGPGPMSGLVPPMKIAGDGVVVATDDHRVAFSVDARGPLAGQVTFFDENEDRRVGIGSFAKFYEDWVDQSWLGAALARAVEGALEKRKPLKPEHHALVVEFAEVFERNGHGIFAAVPRAMFALYMGDRTTAERISDELAVVDEERELVELDGSLYPLVAALYPAELEAIERKDSARIAPLVTHHARKIRCAAALRPELSATALARMAEDESDHVRWRVAIHVNVDADTLARAAESAAKRGLSSTKRFLALEAACRNPKCPVEHASRVIEAYESSKEPLAPWLVRGVAAHRALPIATLERLAKHAHPAMRHAVATHPSTPATLLETLAADVDWAVQKAVAFHPNAPPAALAELTRHPDRAVVEVAIWNRATPVDALVKLVAEARSDLIDALSRTDRLPKPVAAHLKKHPSYNEPDLDWITWPHIDPAGKQAIQTRSHRVRSGPNSDAYLVSASSGEVWIDGAYAHPAFPVPLLRAYVEEHYGNGSREMSDHPWIDEELMLFLSSKRGDPSLDSSTRSAVARHPRMPATRLEELAIDDDEHVPAGVARNRNAPPKLIDSLSKSKHDWTRIEVAKNLATPRATLAALANDEHVNVRRGVAENARTPADVVDQLAKDKDNAPRKMAKWAVASRAFA